MHIVVCVKQVPNTTQVRINPETNTLVRDGVESILNPFDENALEMALQLKEKHAGTKVTVLTMGPPQAETMMRDAYACGADDAVIHSVLLYIARIPSAFLSPYPRCMYILRTRVRNSCKDSRKPYREAPVGLP